MRTVVLVVAAIGMIHGIALADAPPADVTADQAVALYRERNQHLAAATASIDVTAADLVDARLYPNPTLQVGSTNALIGNSDFRSNIGHSQETIEVDIPILVGHQRARREDVAVAHVASARAAVDAERATGELGIRGKFVALQVAQLQATALAAALEDIRAVRAIVAGRAAAGAKSPYDIERIDLAVATLASKVDAARADTEAASGELAAAVGIPSWHPHAVGELAPSTAPTALADSHPELVALRAGEAIARSEVAHAHAEAVVTPSLQLQSLAMTNPFGIAAMIGISLPLQLFDRNQGAIARANAEVHRTDLERVARTTELETTRDAATRLRAARSDALAHFRADALERLPRLRAMAESSYRSGQGGIVELLDALDAITEARLREIELLAGVVGAELAIRAATTGR